MTKEEKKERRRVRHELQYVTAKNLSVHARLRMTPNQVKAAGKVLAERILAGQDHTSFVPME